MPGPLVFQSLHNLVVGRNPPQAAIPFGNAATRPSDVDYIGFGYVGTPGTSGAYFNRGWRLIAPAGSPFAELIAMFTGSLTVHRDALGEVTLRLRPIANMVSLALRHMHVDFLPVPSLIVYTNVDLDATRRQMTAIPDRDSALANVVLTAANESRREAGTPPYADWTDFLRAFFLDATPASGTEQESPYPITVGAGDSIGTMAVSSREPPRHESTVVLKTGSVPGAPNGLWLNPSFYVRSWPLYFADSLVSHILLLELATVIWPPVSNHVFRFVESTGSDSGDFTDPTRPSRTIRTAVDAADPHDTVVILDNATYREDELILSQPVNLTGLSSIDVRGATASEAQLPRLDGGNAHRVIRIENVDPEGLVCLRSIAVMNGRVLNTDDGVKGYLGGGGMLIAHHSPTIVDNCIIKDNQTASGSLGSFNIYDEVDDRLPVLMRALVRSELEDRDREASEDFNRYPNYQLNAEGYGGGISLVYSSPYLIRNRIEDNVAAGGRGGGVGCALYSWPCFEENLIRNNRSESGQRKDGGGVAATLAMPDQQGPALRIRDLIQDFFDHFASHPTTDSNEALTEFFQARQTHWFSTRQVAQASLNNIYFLRNWFEQNEAHDDGGGVYLSVFSQAYFVGDHFENNRARTGNGGGLRATMASNVALLSTTVINNESNSDQRAVDEGGAGGGGVSGRNCQVDIRSDSTVENNTAPGWAGGAVAILATDEGGMAGFRMFHVILTEIYRFRDAHVKIRNARVTNNAATHLSGQRDHGKGGGLYVLRYRNSALPKIPTLRVIVDDLTATISSNNASFPNADNFYLDDMWTMAAAIDDANVGAQLSAGDLNYESLTFD